MSFRGESREILILQVWEFKISPSGRNDRKRAPLIVTLPIEQENRDGLGEGEARGYWQGNTKRVDLLGRVS